MLGFEFGAGESEAFWTEFLRFLRARGLQSTLLVISDAHKGLGHLLCSKFSQEQPGNVVQSTLCAMC